MRRVHIFVLLVLVGLCLAAWTAVLVLGQSQTQSANTDRATIPHTVVDIHPDTDTDGYPDSHQHPDCYRNPKLREVIKGAHSGRPKNGAALMRRRT